MTEATRLFIVLIVLSAFSAGSLIRSKRHYHMPLALFDTPKKKAKKKKRTKADKDKAELEVEA